MSGRPFNQGLTAERLARLMTYDPATGALRSLVKRGKLNVGDALGCINHHGYLMVTVDYVRYSAHRLAWLAFHGAWPTDFVDHINGDRADNRIENLRVVPQSVNLQNQRRPRSHNKSRALGVGHSESSIRPFRARITVAGREIHLGCFSTASLAHSAYLTAKRQLHQGCAI